MKKQPNKNTAFPGRRKEKANNKIFNYFMRAPTSIFNPVGYAKWSVDCFIIGVLCFATWFASAAVTGYLTMDLPEKLFPLYVYEIIMIPAVFLTGLICPTLAVFFMVKYVAPKFFDQKPARFLRWAMSILSALLGIVVVYRYLNGHIVY